MYRTTIQIGVFWVGPEYQIKPRRWFWLARLCAKLHLHFYPLRRAFITLEKTNDSRSQVIREC